SEAVGDLAEQKGPSVGRDAAAAEVGDDGPVTEGRKVERLGITVCHAMAWALEGVGLRVNPNPTMRKAIALYLISSADEKSGLGVSWFIRVHDTRVSGDLAHAKSKKGKPTKPVSYELAAKLVAGGKVPWWELLTKWKNLL